jgi:hypothetical protein
MAWPDELCFMTMRDVLRRIAVRPFEPASEGLALLTPATALNEFAKTDFTNKWQASDLFFARERSCTTVISFAGGSGKTVQFSVRMSVRCGCGAKRSLNNRSD